MAKLRTTMSESHHCFWRYDFTTPCTARKKNVIIPVDETIQRDPTCTRGNLSVAESQGTILDHVFAIFSVEQQPKSLRGVTWIYP